MFTNIFSNNYVKMDKSFDTIKLQILKYSELQALAKRYGIKANMKHDKLVHHIKQHLDRSNSSSESSESSSLPMVDISDLKTAKKGLKGDTSSPKNEALTDALKDLIFSNNNANMSSSPAKASRRQAVSPHKSKKLSSSDLQPEKGTHGIGHVLSNASSVEQDIFCRRCHGIRLATSLPVDELICPGTKDGCRANLVPYSKDDHKSRSSSRRKPAAVDDDDAMSDDDSTEYEYPDSELARRQTQYAGMGGVVPSKKRKHSPYVDSAYEAGSPAFKSGMSSVNSDLSSKNRYNADYSSSSVKRGRPRQNARDMRGSTTSASRSPEAPSTGSIRRQRGAKVQQEPSAKSRRKNDQKGSPNKSQRKNYQSGGSSSKLVQPNQKPRGTRNPSTSSVKKRDPSTSSRDKSTASSNIARKRARSTRSVRSKNQSVSSVRKREPSSSSVRKREPSASSLRKLVPSARSISSRKDSPIPRKRVPSARSVQSRKDSPMPRKRVPSARSVQSRKDSPMPRKHVPSARSVQSRIDSPMPRKRVPSARSVHSRKDSPMPRKRVPSARSVQSRNLYECVQACMHECMPSPVRKRVPSTRSIHSNQPIASSARRRVPSVTSQRRHAPSVTSPRMYTVASVISRRTPSSIRSIQTQRAVRPRIAPVTRRAIPRMRAPSVSSMRGRSSTLRGGSVRSTPRAGNARSKGRPPAKSRPQTRLPANARRVSAGRPAAGRKNKDFQVYVVYRPQKKDPPRKRR